MNKPSRRFVPDLAVASLASGSGVLLVTETAIRRRRLFRDDRVL
jgi:hypothetical protein